MHEISTALAYYFVGLVKTSSFYFVSGVKIAFKDTTSCHKIFSLEECGGLKNYSMLLLLDIKLYLLAMKILAHFVAVYMSWEVTITQKLLKFAATVMPLEVPHPIKSFCVLLVLTYDAGNNSANNRSFFMF